MRWTDHAFAGALLLAACSASSKPAPAGEAPSDAGGANADAGTDATSAPPHTPGTWCAARTETFCEDFDTPAFTAGAWVVNDTKGTGGTGLPAGALDTTNHTSAPNAFTARTPAIAGATVELLQLEGGAFGPDASHVDADLAFAVRVASVGAGPRTEIARVEGVDPITFASYRVALLVSASGAALELTAGPTSTTHALAAAPPIGAWSRIALHLALERTVYGPPTSVTIQVDAAPPETFAMDRGMGVRPFLHVGLAVTGPSAPCEVAYDDLTYDAR